MMNAKEIANKAIAQAKTDWVKAMTEDFYADEKKKPLEIGVIGVGNTIIVAYADNVDEPIMGIAKCNPADRYDRELGIAIAYARAIGEDVPDYVLDSNVPINYDEDYDDEDYDDDDDDWDEDDDWDYDDEDEDDDWGSDDDDDWDDDDDDDWDDDDDDDDWDDWDDDENYSVEFGEIGIGGKFIDDDELYIKVSNNKAYRYEDKQTIDFDKGYYVDTIVTD